jgi:hypothetical protein
VTLDAISDEQGTGINRCQLPPVMADPEAWQRPPA